MDLDGRIGIPKNNKKLISLFFIYVYFGFPLEKQNLKYLKKQHFYLQNL